MYCCHPADNWITITITITNNLLRQISCNIQSLKYYYFRSIVIGLILFLYNIFLCDADNIYISILLIIFTQCFFFNYYLLFYMDHESAINV